MPTVSVIVPVYNVAPYLKQCLDSLVHQTLDDMEIICVNDGSIDGSVEMLEVYSRNYNNLKVISQENRGLSAARNTGIDVASGRYIGFVDGDDWVTLDIYEKLYKGAINNGVDIVASNTICYSDKTARYYKDYHFFHSNLSIEYGVSFNVSSVCNEILDMNVSACNKLFSRELFRFNDCLRFEDGYKFEDLLFHLTSFLVSRSCLYLEDRGYIYRNERANSIMTSFDSAFDIFPVSEKVIKVTLDYGNEGALQKHVLSFVLRKQHDFLKRIRRDRQEEFFNNIIMFWSKAGEWRSWPGAEDVLKHVSALEATGFDRWKRRDRLRAAGLSFLRYTNLDYSVKNLRSRIRNSRKNH